MLILPNGDVWLDKDEIVPCYCECGRIYQPAADSLSSVCPGCGHFNDHSKAPPVAEVPFAPND